MVASGRVALPIAGPERKGGEGRIVRIDLVFDQVSVESATDKLFHRLAGCFGTLTEKAVLALGDLGLHERQIELPMQHFT